MIHVIGDSHVSIFSNSDAMVDIWSFVNRNIWSKFNKINNNYFKVYRLGALTAHGLSLNKQKIEEVLNYSVDKKYDKVVFSFGEVDIRNHIMKNVGKGKNMRMETINVVNEYFKVIKYYKSLGYDIIVWGPIASHAGGYSGPSFGTNKERNECTEFFNTYLGTICNEEGVKFLTIYKSMLNEDGTTNKEWLDNWPGSQCHINPNKYVDVVKLFKKQKLL